MTESQEWTVEASPVDLVERASIDSQVSTAKRYPRVLSKVKQDMLSFATLDEETAAACFFSLPRGGKVIQGPSIRMAEIAIACYGNMRAGTRIISIQAGGDNPHVVVQAVGHDLEKNTAITIEKRRAIYKKRGKDAPDDDDINLATNACSAVAIRDATFKIVPRALITPVYEQAKRLAVGDIKSLSSKRAQVMERLKQMTAKESNILAAVGAKTVEDIDLAKLEILIGLGTALKEGSISIEEAFPGPKIEPVQFLKTKAADAAAPPPTPPTQVATTTAPQEPNERDQLIMFVEEELNAPFSVFLIAIQKTNLIAGADKWTEWASIPDDAVKKLLRAKGGIRAALGEL